MKKVSFLDWIVRYEERFGDRPTTVHMKTDEVISLIQKALETGVPIPEPNIPDGALI